MEESNGDWSALVAENERLRRSLTNLADEFERLEQRVYDSGCRDRIGILHLPLIAARFVLRGKDEHGNDPAPSGS